MAGGEHRTSFGRSPSDSGAGSCSWKKISPGPVALLPGLGGMSDFRKTTKVFWLLFNISLKKNSLGDTPCARCE